VKIRLVVFDIAGTTVEDPDGVGGCLKAALSAKGVDWEAEAVNAVMGIPKPIAIRMLLDRAQLAPPEEELADEIHRDFQARMIDYYKTSPDVRPMDGAVETFQILRGRGVKVALDTGFDRTIVDVLMERLGWGSDLLDATVTSDEVPRGRPYPDLIFEAMARTGVDNPVEVAKVGDTPSDLQEGTAAGCALVIGVTNGTHARALMEGHPHTHLVESVKDVPAVLVGA
jgi:phosphonatase-like hydrolase